MVKTNSGSMEDSSTDFEEKQYIVFSAGNQDFGVEIMQTREIINMSELTDMPNSPDFIKGIVNLRGEIVPIVDLEKRLMKNDTSLSADEGRIIVVSINENLVGMQVNQVEGIIRLDTSKIGQAPDITTSVRSNFIKGVGKLEERLLIILDLVNVLTAEEVEQIEELDTE
ncbi:chemotaxis protein CheW [Halarsenatibacter silvermanii]|uniref:Purine-binding chemotaxis protein CheW n=1 Tax=Halarsenatibacter silvermanii TaxID=321763 RepID=A0A1G9LFA7_9FIRM|nr:chemotaxis protein CheW [Halarsenatibacter silvermanii]SDL60566.1 purine-binding chemotaxis protein CheW [Halarsenatibacter silvermanii]